VALDTAIVQQMVEDGEAKAPVVEDPPKPPAFSEMMDRNGYNARILSEGRIDCILMTDFMHRKSMQMSKMLGIDSEILKLDFSYKLPKKICVYQGRGISFKPYKSLCIIQNENNLTVYYKCTTLKAGKLSSVV
jgi:hypothetical protein